MKAASKIFRIFVVGMAIMSSLLVSYDKVSAQQVTESYSGYWYANLYNDYQFQNSQSQQGFADIVIITTSDNATGSIRITRFTGYDTFEYQGKYTYYSHVPISNQALVTSDHLTGTFTDQVSYTEGELSLDASQLQDILDSIDAVDSTDQDILSYLATMKTDIESKLTDLISAVNNIDTLIDTISWVDQGEIIGYSTTRDGTYSNSNISSNQESIYFKLSPGTYTSNRIIKLETKITNATRTSAGNLSGITTEWWLMNNDTEAYSVREPNVFVLNNGPYLSFLVYSNISTASNYTLVVKVTAANKNLRVASGRNSKVSYLVSDDIEYWQIMAYLETHEYYNKQNTELDQPNEDLSDSVDDYVETEDTLINDFDTAISNNSVDPLQIPNSNPGNWGTGFTGSLGLIGHVFNMLTASATGGNAVYLLMNFSLMLGLALLIIGKRG